MMNESQLRMELNLLRTCPNMQANHLISANNEPIAKRVLLAKSQQEQGFQTNPNIFCCSKHLKCIGISPKTNKQSTTILHSEKYRHPSDQFSIDSNLLEEEIPLNISQEPEIQNNQRIEIDLLASANVKIKKYQHQIQIYYQQQEQSLRNAELEKVSIQAKLALQKAKKMEINSKDKWGHSIFGQIQERLPENKQVQIQQKLEPIEQKTILKPIQERIKQYKEKQAQCERKTRQQNQFRKQPFQKDVIMQRQRKIEQNSIKILNQLQKEKNQKEQKRKLIQAKIRALQLKSLQNVQQCKKKILLNNQEMHLSDSQYSTFDARAQGRKLIKKPKKTKPNKNSAAQPEKMQKTFLKSSSKRQFVKKQSNEKNMIVKTKQEEQKKQQLIKPEGKFYFWEMPIATEDYNCILNNQENEMYLNVDKFNKKEKKSFREEANELLTAKMNIKMKENWTQIKEDRFLKQVAAKKEELNKQFSKTDVMKECWNEDELFRGNGVANFEYFGRSETFA